MFGWDDITRDELRAEAAAERRRLRPHFCMTCLGHTGQGSPCAPDEDEPQEDEEDPDYCGGCNPEPTIDELDTGICASCGKELA